MINQLKAMLALDMERYIEKAFQASERDEARHLCLSVTLHDGSPAQPRHVRCALIASRSSLALLRKAIEHLKVDYRDIIVEGEYAPQEGKLVRVRNLEQPIGDDN